eukprot:2704727-Amphidinium_carterae.2
MLWGALIERCGGREMKKKLGNLEGVLQQLRAQLGEQVAAHQAAMAERAARLQVSQFQQEIMRLALKRSMSAQTSAAGAESRTSKSLDVCSGAFGTSSSSVT